MKTILISWSLFVIISFSLFCADNEKRHIDTYVSFGTSIPSQPVVFSEYWNTGFNFGIGVSYRFHPQWSIMTDIHYNVFTLDNRKYLLFYYPAFEFPVVNGGSRYILSISGNLKWSFYNDVSWFSTFLTGGAGLLKSHVSDMYVSGSDLSDYFNEIDESMAAVLLGTGIEINPEGVVGLVLESRFSYSIFHDNPLRYFVFRAGIRMRF